MPTRSESRVSQFVPILLPFVWCCYLGWRHFPQKVDPEVKMFITWLPIAFVLVAVVQHSQLRRINKLEAALREGRNESSALAGA